MKKSTLSASQQRYSMTPIEIQVASVLMHAWAEVEHDLVYKPLHGTISEDEHAILDELNGLVLSGEIALERLQKAVEIRVGGKSRKFRNHYELASHLLEAAKPIQKGLLSEPSMGRVDLLYRLLVKSDMDKPDKIAPLIKAIKTITERRPIAEQIADAILASKPDLYKAYEDIRNEQDISTMYGITKAKTVTSKKEQAIGFFINQWIQLEKILGNLIKQKIPKEPIYRIMSPVYIKQLHMFDVKTINDIDRFRRFRNMLVHGIEIPNVESLVREGKSLEELVNNLKRMLPKDMK